MAPDNGLDHLRDSLRRGIDKKLSGCAQKLAVAREAQFERTVAKWRGSCYMQAAFEACQKALV